MDFTRVQSKDIVMIIEHWQAAAELTVSCTNTLAFSREFQCFSNGHFTDVKVTLTDVGCCSLRHKLIVSVSIERYFPCDTQVLCKSSC